MVDPRSKRGRRRERYKRRAVGNKIDNARRRSRAGSPPGAQDAADNNLVVNIS